LITKNIELDGSEIAINDGYRKIVTAYGLSTDEKPIDGYKNADRFIEMDTGNVSIFDEENKKWCEI
jgi:hypothetical protein